MSYTLCLSFLQSPLSTLPFPLSFGPSLSPFQIDITPPPLKIGEWMKKVSIQKVSDICFQSSDSFLHLFGAGPGKNFKKYLAPFGGLDWFIHLSPRPSGRRDVRGRGQRPQEGVDGQGHSGMPLSPVKSNYKLNIVYACYENLKYYYTSHKQCSCKTAS
jgi:hypothetical protein